MEHPRDAGSIRVWFWSEFEAFCHCLPVAVVQSDDKSRSPSKNNVVVVGAFSEL